MRKMSRMLLILVLIFFNVASVSADVFYSVSDYSSGAVGSISGKDNPEKSVIQNLNGDAIVVSFFNPDGKSRIATIGRDSWISGVGDEWKVYNPYGVRGWNSAPLAEFMTKYTNGSFAGTADGNGHAVASIGNKLYVAYWGNTYNYFGMDHSSKVVCIDMSNDYEKTAEYLYEPDPDYTPSNPDSVAANCSDVYAYNGKVYVLYSGYRGNAFADTSVVIEFDQDLKPLRTCKLKGINLYGTSCINGNKLYIASVGGSVYGASPTNPESCVEVVDLDNMTSEKIISTASMQEKTPEWELNFGGVAVTDDGTMYLQCFYFSMSESAFPMQIYKTTYDRLKAGDIGDLLQSITFSGWSLDMVYDPETKFLWNAAGTDLYRYDGSDWVKFDSTALGGNIYNLTLTHEVKAPVASGDVKVVPVDTPAFVIPEAGEGVSADIPEWSGKAAETLAAIIGGSVQSSDIIELNTGGMTFKSERIIAAAEALLNTDNAKVTDVRNLPIFDLNLSSSKTLAATTFVLSGDALFAGKPEDVQIIKIQKTFEAISFRYAATSADYTDGHFVILTESDDVATTIDPGVNYKLVLYIEDGGKYDLNKTVGVITDPVVIVRTVAVDNPQPTPGSGGCNAVSEILALLALLPAAVIVRKRSKTTIDQ